MRDFFRRMGDNFRRFMYGRCGLDGYGKFLIALALILIIVAGFFSGYVNLVITVVAWAVLIYAYSRIFSKRLGKRTAENYKFYEVLNKIKGFFGYGVDRNSRYFKCPGCKKKVKVPRYRGKIEITCRNCGTQFIRYTGKRR